MPVALLCPLGGDWCKPDNLITVPLTDTSRQQHERCSEMYFGWVPNPRFAPHVHTRSWRGDPVTAIRMTTASACLARSSAPPSCTAAREVSPCRPTCPRFTASWTVVYRQVGNNKSFPVQNVQNRLTISSSKPSFRFLSDGRVTTRFTPLPLQAAAHHLLAKTSTL